MKVILFYNSRFGNGKTVCEYMCSLLQKHGLKTDCFSIADVNPKKIPSADLFVFSSSTHLGNAPFKTRAFLKRIRGHRGKYIIVTTNMDPGSAKTLKTMQDILNGKGFTEIATPLTLKVQTLKGPLEKTYKNKIENYVSRIRKELDEKSKLIKKD